MNFYDELANIFDEDKVTDDTHFKQLDKWDSITLMTLQQSLQSNFGVKLSLKDIMTAETIADLKSKCNMKSLFVTGASSGIGREIAVELSEKYNLILCSRNEDKLKETACLCNKQSEVRLFSYDLTKVDNLSSDLGNYLAKENITVQKFVHCAGTARMKHLHMITSEDFISMYNVYTVSAAMIIKALAGRANKRELNSVVFI